MALKLNGRIAFYNNPGVYAGAVYGQPGNFIKGGLRSRNAGGLSSRFSGYSNGTLAPSAFILPQKSGSIATFNYLAGAVSLASSAVGGKNAEASLSGAIDLTNADMGLIVSAIAALSASVSVTNAELAAVLNMVANSLSATGTLNAPILGALAGVAAELSAQATLTSGSMNNSPGFMASEITPYTTLSPESLAASLLNALLASYNDPGSVGEALNSIGAASNPWSSTLAGNNDSGSFGEHIQKLLKKSDFIGLK